MITASVTAARERMRKFVDRLEQIEWVALALALAFAVAAAFAIHADSIGQKWPTVITSLIVAGLVVSLLGAGFGWAIVGSATALARRIDVAAAMGEEAMSEAKALRANLEALTWAVQALNEGQRAIIAELGRMRYDERERAEKLQTLAGIVAYPCSEPPTVPHLPTLSGLDPEVIRCVRVIARQLAE